MSWRRPRSPTRPASSSVRRSPSAVWTACSRGYLELDAQGWDLEVLRGAEGRLDRVTALQPEMSFRAHHVDMPSFAEAWDVMSGYGFEMSGVFPITAGRDLRLIEADCVAVRPGGAGQP